MVKERKSGIMAPYILVTLSMEMLMVMALFTINMGISMMVNLRMIWRMAMDNLNTKTVKFTKAIGKMISRKEKEKK